MIGPGVALMLALEPFCEGARVLGDDSLADELTRALRTRGTYASCGRAFARLTEAGPEYELQVSSDGRLAAWKVGNAAVAAILVEAWIDRELTSQLLDGPVGGEPGSARTDVMPMVGVEARNESVVEPSSNLELRAAFESSMASDGALALGAGIEAAVPFGGLLFGARGHGYSGLPDRPDASRTATVRRGAELLVGAGWPIAVDGFLLSPSGWVGAGVLETARSDSGREGCVANCPPLVADGFAVASFGVRGELALALSYGLGASYSLVVSAFASYAPGASSDAIVPAYASALPESDQSKLALSPEAPLRFGVGLGLGAAP